MIKALSIYTANPQIQMESQKFYSYYFLPYSSKYSSKALHLKKKITAVAYMANYVYKSNSPERGKCIIKETSILIRNFFESIIHSLYNHFLICKFGIILPYRTVKLN